MSAKFLWKDKAGKGRNVFCRARKTFNIDSPVVEAKINIFADTMYKLYVNGKYVEFGPVRFDPKYPVYDEHDISALLKEGKNVICLTVNFIGHKVFRTIPQNGCFITWGEVKLKDGSSFNLDSDINAYKIKEAAEYGRPSPKLSFALQDGETYNQNFADEGWENIDYDDSGWDWAVPLENQNAFGKPEKREIPFMDKSGVKIDNIRLFSVKKDEDFYSFEVPFLPDRDVVDPEDKGKYADYMTSCTWIYSPVNQIIKAGAFYGDVYINGKPPLKSNENKNKSLRYDQLWQLNQGWNRYFCSGSYIAGVIYHYFALPSNKGLIVSADKDPSSGKIFLRAPVITRKQHESLIKDKPFPYGENETLEEIGGWITVMSSEKAESACMEMSWNSYEDAVETVNSENLNGFVIKKEIYPDGFYMIFDLDKMTLFQQDIILSGSKGAKIDFVYAEFLCKDKIHPQIFSWVPLGERIICSNDKEKIGWTSFHSKGARYLCMAVTGYSSDITIEKFELTGASYPAVKRGSFKCSNPLYNEVWEMGLRTLQSNMEDAYVDCSGRERGMYIRDSIIQYHSNLSCIGDHKLMKRCLELFAQSPSLETDGKFKAVYPNTGSYSISDFSLNMIEGLWNYYQFTGDASISEKYWDNIKNNLKWFLDLSDEREDKLLDAEWDKKRNIKSEYGGFHGDLGVPKEIMDKTKINAMFTFIYMSALLCAVKISKTIGRYNTPEVKDYENRYNKLKENCDLYFWNDKLGCYADTTEKNCHSLQTNTLAVIAEAAGPDKMKKIAAYIKSKHKSLFINGYDPNGGVIMSPAFAFYIFEGLYRLGLCELAEKLISDGWGWALSMGMKTCPEYFRNSSSLCHAWSASPTYYLSREIGGVHFPEAGNSNIVEIKVNCSDETEWAEVSYPHEKGLINVKWHTESDVNGKKIRVFDLVDAPGGVDIKVI